MATYDIGDRVRLSSVFKASDGVVTSPTTVTLTVRSPAGVSTPTITNPSTGNYYADVDPTISGNWFYRWAGTGTLVVAEEGQFHVRERKA